MIFLVLYKLSIKLHAIVLGRQSDGGIRVITIQCCFAELLIFDHHNMASDPG